MRLVAPKKAGEQARAKKPEPLCDDDIFALFRDRWPGAGAVVRTSGPYIEFRVSAKESGKMHAIERLERREAVEINSFRFAYCEDAKTIVVFQ